MNRRRPHDIVAIALALTAVAVTVAAVLLITNTVAL